MLESIADFLSLYLHFKFDKDKKKRRQFEKENNLPKKFMINPLIWIVLFVVVLGSIIGIGISVYQHYYANNKNITEKIIKIEQILEKEKESLGIYPEKLTDIIRNNPLRKNICLDIWGNEYHYELLENGKNYVLLSKGLDGILNTDDDVNGNKNLP